MEDKKIKKILEAMDGLSLRERLEIKYSRSLLE
nr:MAG TPA: hypothetical protein [Caudoviricetes sp.]